VTNGDPPYLEEGVGSGPPPLLSVLPPLLDSVDMRSTRISPIFPLTLLVIAGCAPGPEVAAPVLVVVEKPVKVLPKTYGRRVLARRSNLRDTTSTRGRIIATLPAGTEVGLVNIENGWFNVVVDTVVAWVYAPLVKMTEQDRWDAAISAAKPGFPHPKLYAAMYRDGKRLRIVLDIGWRDLSMTRKTRTVERIGASWKTASKRMGFGNPPEIRLMSNNDVEMASWHAFWGAKVRH